MGVQVQLATKNREGLPLPITKRQFISFSFGGKNIEDFNLLAVFSDGRLDKEIYFPFNDITSQNEVIDGQIFWLSVMQAGQLSFNLATDGMTSEEYEAFKNWFVPGKPRELVLSEFSNRAVLARLAAPPQISLLPFESKQTFKIAGTEKTISTSLYKGDISLEFVIDEPYWYSLQNLINDSLEDYQYSEEDLKIIYEDKIPSVKMFDNESEDFFLIGDKFVIQKQAIKNELDEETQDYKPYGVNVNEESSVYLYNCGTAAAKPIVSFKIKPVFDNTNLYIVSPANSYSEDKISTLTIGNQVLKFTTPSILTSYNHTLEIIQQVETGDSILELRQKLRDELYNYYTRAWAIAIVDGLKNSDQVTEAGSIIDQDSFRQLFALLMKKSIEDSVLECTINSNTGEATIKTTCKIASTYIQTIEEAAAMETVSVVENAGDMIKSKYLKLEDRTIFNSDGKITKDECVQITSTCDLTDLKISFKYTYL